MAADDTGISAQTAAARARFMTAYLAQRFDAAVDIFLDALKGDPDGAFRHFALNAAGQLPQAVVESSRVDEVAARLDAMIGDHPNIHLICPEAPGEIGRRIAMRERNIDVGLPSMVLVSMGKSASIAVANIFNSGFRLPTFAYSLFNLQVIESWARDFARGGVSYTTHLDPSRETVARLKRAGISRIIVHVRDPRQTLLSLVHHFDKYPDQLVIYREQAKDAPSLSARAMSVLPLYMSSINWVRGWLDLDGEIEILFSTFEDFIKDRASFVERYLEFYGADRRHFSMEDAFGEHTGIDNHFRRGLTDEWRQVFSREDAAYLSSLLPLRAKERFGWGDLEEAASASNGGAVAPTRRDRVVAWLKQISEPGDAAARAEVDRLLAAGQPVSADLEERAARANLRDYPDQGGTLLQLWRRIVDRGGHVPEGLAVHALRSRLADLSGPPEAGTSIEQRETERLALARELAIAEILEQAAAGRSVRQLLLEGTIAVPDAEGWVKLADILTRRQDFDAAEVAYRRAIELDPAPPSSLYRSLADVIDASGRPKEAIELLQRRIEQSPREGELLAQLGRALTRQGNLAGAAATYRKAVKLDPGSSELRRQLNEVAREEAVRNILERAAAGGSVQELLLEGTIEVPDAEGYVKLAQALTRQQDFEGAEVAYLRAIELDPAPSPALYRALADVIDANGRSQEAIEILRTLAEQSSADVELLARLGHLLTRQGDFAAATQAYRKAVLLDPAAPQLRRRLADVLDADGHWHEAVEILESLASEAPQDGELQARLGHVLIRCGDLARAETALRKRNGNRWRAGSGKLRTGRCAGRVGTAGGSDRIYRGAGREGGGRSAAEELPRPLAATLSGADAGRPGA